MHRVEYIRLTIKWNKFCWITNRKYDMVCDDVGMIVYHFTDEEINKYGKSIKALCIKHKLIEDKENERI